MHKELKKKQANLTKENNRLIRLQKQAIKNGDADEVERLRVKLAKSVENMFEVIDEIINT